MIRSFALTWFIISSSRTCSSVLGYELTSQSATNGASTTTNSTSTTTKAVFQAAAARIRTTKRKHWIRWGPDLYGEPSREPPLQSSMAYTFGDSVSTSADGGMIAIGSMLDAGEEQYFTPAQVFKFDAVSREWSSMGTPLGNYETVQLSHDGQTLLGRQGDWEDAPTSYQLYRFHPTLKDWQEATFLNFFETGDLDLPSDYDGVNNCEYENNFGKSWSLSDDGLTVLVHYNLHFAEFGCCSYWDGTCYSTSFSRVFRYNAVENRYEKLGQDLPADNEAHLSRFNPNVWVGSGLVYQFNESSRLWEQLDTDPIRMEDSFSINESGLSVFQYDKNTGRRRKIGQTLKQFKHNPESPDNDRYTISLSSNGRALLVCKQNFDKGYAVKVFRIKPTRNGPRWVKVGRMHRFPTVPVLSADGRSLIVGDPKCDLVQVRLKPDMPADCEESDIEMRDPYCVMECFGGVRVYRFEKLPMA